MTLKDQIILEDYRKALPAYIQLEPFVADRIRQMLEKENIKISSVKHRLKTGDSLRGKLTRYGDRFQVLGDLYDVLGFRIICCFHDDVDRIGRLIEEWFDVDAARSCDKRTLLNPAAFGYLSLHYVCSIPESCDCPEELKGICFEIQIRTILQHAWAEIEHDLGYKSEFGIPASERRSFARIAGLLELADNEFVRVRDNIRSYADQIRNDILNDNTIHILIDQISLTEYMLCSKKMRSFLDRLAGIEHSEIEQTNPETYIPQLEWLGIRTIGQLQQMLEQYEEQAFAMAQRQILGSELDILSSNVALRYLCRSKLASEGYSLSQATEFIGLTVKNPDRARRQAEALLRAASSD